MADQDETPAKGLSPKMREMAEENVSRAKKAYDEYVATTERLLNTMEDAARLAWSGARDVNVRVAAFADANAKAGFDYAERFLRAKDGKEVVELQAEFLRQASSRLTEQLRELNDLATRATRETIEAVQRRN